MILKLPSLSQRCTELCNLIKERFACNMSRNVLSQFRPIVENIFGCDTSTNQLCPSMVGGGNLNSTGWMLKTLTKNLNAMEYDAVVSFLHPEGMLFGLIKALMHETSAKFEFPVSQFPPYFRAMIENGTAPPFFSTKVISTNYTSTSHLILNPFEFYVFHFGLYILNNSGTNLDPTAGPTNEPAYFTLLKVYLDYFVPLEGAPRSAPNLNNNPGGLPASIWQSLSSTTSSILNLGSNQQASSASNSQTSQNVPSLFKASLFQPQTPFNKTSTSFHMTHPGPILYGQGEHHGSLEWRCSTFLLMLTELWFGNIPAPKTNYILKSTSLDDLSVNNVQPYSANIDQMTCVRVVIKHLHNFSNSFTYNPVSHANYQGLAEIKQAIWTSKYPLQKRLYTFIKVAFNRWPMDYTFRQPLEAWLSYVQPWRYVKVNNDFNSDIDDFDGNRSTSLIDVPSIDNHWRNFISDNLLYYTVIFSQLIDRLLQLDLSSSRNALMLFRVVKVYTQPGFLPLLREAEEAAMRTSLEQTINTTSKSHKISTLAKSLDAAASKIGAPSFSANGRRIIPESKVGALEHHLMNLESDSEFHYVSLFSPQMKMHLSKLLAAVQKSRLSIKDFVQSVEVRSKLRSRSWFESIRSFLLLEDASFESKDEREMYKDKIQAEEYLNFVSNKIVQCFEIQLPEIDLQRRNASSLTSSCQNPKIFFNF